MKNTQRGYFDLPIEEGTKTIHFSTNCWFNLLEDTGLELDVFGEKLQTLFNDPTKNMLGIINCITDLAWAAAKAYDQEEDNKIDYNRFKVRSWITNLSEEDTTAFMKAMMHSVSTPKTEGKQ